MPRKPSQLLRHYVFSPSGHVRAVTEALPESKEELEATLCTKFVSALALRFGRQLLAPEKEGPWPDFWTAEDGRRIGLEMVEIVNPDHIRYTEIRRRYINGLTAELAGILETLPGLVLELSDGYQHVEYPPFDTDAGRQIRRVYYALVRETRDKLAALAAGKILPLRGVNGPNGELIGFTVTRDPDVTRDSVIVFRRTYPVSTERALQLLWESIQHKIAKGYQRSSDWDLWLLAYDNSGALVHRDAKAAKSANANLKNVTHPFSEVWAMTPTAGEIPSFLESVWPSTDYTSTEQR